MSGRIKKGFKFDVSKPAQARAVVILDLMGRKQAAFISELIDVFIKRYGIDPNSTSREEIEAVLVLSRKGKEIKEYGEEERTDERKVTDEVTNRQNAPVKGDRLSDESEYINEELLSQMNMFE